MTTPTVLRPTTDLVVQTWLTSVVGVPNAGPVLPADESTWSDGGFVQLATIGGNSDLDNPIRRPVLQIDCYAVNPNSQKAPWGKANALAEQIIAATYDYATSRADLTLPGNFGPARVTAAFPYSEPRRLYGDVQSAGLARYEFQLQIYWVAL